MNSISVTFITKTSFKQYLPWATSIYVNMWLIHRSYCKVFFNVQGAWERNILIRRATHLCPVRRASGIFDSSNTTKGLLFRKWFYPLYLLGTPHDIFFLLFSAMHFCKVRKIINYLPIHLKTLLSRVTWTLVGQIQCSKRNGIVSR
jgi:hypothetical protein